MSLEITMRVNGLDFSSNGSSDPSKTLVDFLEGIEGVLGARYDWESHRFAVSYDPNRITLLRILNRIEFEGRETGLTYRPTDVQTRLGRPPASESPKSRPDRTLPVAEPLVHSRWS